MITDMIEAMLPTATMISSLLICFFACELDSINLFVPFAFIIVSPFLRSDRSRCSCMQGYAARATRIYFVGHLFGYGTRFVAVMATRRDLREH